MSKDPAFLFYPGDWLGGTMTLTRNHKGAYIDLLMAQFNSGHLSENQIAVVLGENDFRDLWPGLKSKFKIDSDGLYYNERLENEMIKRRNYSESRKRNLRAHMENHMDNHMESHMEDENEVEKTGSHAENCGKSIKFDEMPPINTHMSDHMGHHMEHHMENENENININENRDEIEIKNKSKKEKVLGKEGEIEDIINDLNYVLGTGYKSSTPKTIELIRARLKEGFSIDDFKTVHRKMLKSWGADPKMCKYLRPVTLYGTKFECYLNSKESTTTLTESGIQAYLVGQEWLKKNGDKNAG